MALFLLAPLSACIGERIAGEVDAGSDSTIVDPSKGGIKVTITGSTPKAGSFDKIELRETEVLQLSVVLEATGGFDVSNYQVRWCTAVAKAGQFTKGKDICLEGLDCSLSASDQINKRQGTLLIPPGQFSAELDAEEGQKVEFQLTARAIRNDVAGADVCDLSSAEVQKASSASKIVVVLKSIPAPATKILPSWDDTSEQKCHSTVQSVRSEIKAVAGYESASYKVSWYRNAVTPEHKEQSGTVKAEDGYVCGDPSKAPSAEAAACILPAQSTVKGERWFVTAQVTTTNKGEAVAGEETAAPGFVDICNSWPDCGSKPVFSADPIGAQGKLTCSLSCQDADFDKQYAEFVIKNETNGKVITDVVGPVGFGGLPSATVASVVDLAGPEGLDFAKKTHTIRCTARPYSDGQDPDAKDQSYPSQYESFSNVLTIQNTPPSVDGKKVSITVDGGLPTVNASFTCVLPDGAFGDVDAEDVPDLKFDYQWRNASTGKTYTAEKHLASQKPFNPPEARELNPKADAPNAFKAGERLCCDVMVLDNADQTTALMPVTSCIQLVNSTPVLVDKKDMEEGKNPDSPTVPVKVFVKVDDKQTEFDACKDPDDPLPDDGVNPYTVQTFLCDAGTALPYDADVNGPDGVSPIYTFFECGSGKVLFQKKYDPPTSKPNVIPRGTDVCCKVQLCDSAGCGVQYESENKLTVGNTPPAFLSTPEVAPADFGSLGDKWSSFECLADFTDCDTADVKTLAETATYYWTVAPVGEPPTSILTPEPGNNVMPDSLLSDVKCGEGQEIGCRVVLNDQKGGTKESDWSGPWTLSNQAPKIGQVSIEPNDVQQPVAVGTTVRCRWANLSDPNGSGEQGDTIKELSVRLRVGQKGVASPETPDNPTGGWTPIAETVVKAPDAEGYVTFDLGTCTTPLADSVKKGALLSCDAQAIDDCGAQSVRISSVTPPTFDTLEIVNSAPSFLAGAVSLSPTVGEKGTTYKCSVDKSRIVDCDPGEPDSFKFVFQLKPVQPDGTPLPNVFDELPITSNAVGIFPYEGCPPESHFVCSVDVYDSGGGILKQGLLSGTTAEVLDQAPAPKVDLVPQKVQMGTLLACSVAPNDDSPGGVKTGIEWFKNGVKLPQFDEFGTITLDSSAFKKNDSVTCRARVNDGCNPEVEVTASPVTIANTPPTYGKVDLTPTTADVTTKLVCTPGAWVDPDMDPQYDAIFQWEVRDAASGNVYKPIPSGCMTKEKTPTGFRSVIVNPGSCGGSIRAGVFVRCSVTGLDSEQATAAQATPVVSNEQWIQDANPQFTGEVTVVKTDPSLSTAPFLDEGQGNMECAAPVDDPDGQTDWKLTYQWSLIPAGLGLESAIAIPAQVDPKKLFLGQLSTPVPQPCDQVFCTAKLYNSSDQFVTQAASQPVSLWKGGSLKFTGKSPVVAIEAQPPAGSDPVPGNPDQGYVELWYWPVDFPGAGANEHILAGTGTGLPLAEQWDLRIAAGGLVQLRWGGGVTLSMTAQQQAKAKLEAGKWHHIGVRWTQTGVYLYVNGTEAASWSSTTKPFNLATMKLGDAVSGPVGYLDELRVRGLSGVLPDTGEQYFGACKTGTVAVYHFEPANGGTVIDGSGHGFNGKFAIGQPSWSYHGQINTCGAEDCGAGCNNVGNCLLPPTKVKNELISAVDETSVVTSYNVRCTAGGSLDLSGGSVTQYLFEWVDVNDPAAGNIAQATGGKGTSEEGVFQEAKIKVAKASGCIQVQCRATPLSENGANPGPSGLSKVGKLCYSNELAAYKMVGFDCDDGTACTANVANDSLGCMSTNDDSASCSAVCETYELAGCSGGVCLCKPKCASANPCEEFDYMGLNGECQFKDKPNGAACTVSANQCAEGTEGSCQVGTCQPSVVKSCDDGNACTDDLCDPKAGCSHTSNTIPCDDGNACTVDDLCGNSLCKGTGKVCNDSNPCTEDTCDQASGCTYVNLIKPCSDGNECTANDMCGGGVCVPGAIVAGDDGNDCTDDVCNPQLGCQHTANQDPCNDANACTSNDFCSGGACIGAAKVCNDGKVCTDDTCDKATGCAFTPATKPCDDGNACTADDACNAGGFCTGTAVACDDGNPCTTDYCLPGSGCKHDNNTLPCNDGDACTKSDKCSGGSCVGQGASCDDGNQCTTDSCNTVTGCVNVPFAGACDDGNPCTSDDLCFGKDCIGGAGVDCNAGNDNPCKQSYCEPGGGCTPLITLDDGASCSDGSACTKDDKCVSGTCAGTNVVCNDNNPCTNDSCNPTTGCIYQNNSTLCDDGDACTVGDVCKLGACASGSDMVCNDGNPCTNDSCDHNAVDPAQACKYINNTIPCNDGSVCTLNDQCVLGQCKGQTINCADTNSCTDDGCNATTGCFHTNNNVVCDDKDSCTSASQCVNGACQGTAATVCNDNNPCTDDSCNASIGCVFTPNTQPCNDGKVCTEADTCAGGACNGTAKICNDNDPCTSDTCIEPSACVYTAISGPSCNDGNVCTLTDICQTGACTGSNPKVCNDGKVCTDDSCDPTTGCKYTNNLAGCDDSNPCTTTDLCQNGVCVGTGGLSCEDGNPCTTDSCNGGTGCTHSNNTLPCDDGNACTQNDKCQSGGCTNTQGVNCDDGNPCTADSCDPATGCKYTPQPGPCTDKNECTTGDTCSGGSCVTTGTPNCDDSNACTTDSCDIVAGCKHTNLTGSTCNDGSICTTDDKCAAGVCGGTAVDCSDGNQCTNDSCDPATGCKHTNVSGNCNDGNACTTGDTCQAGTCTGGSALDCNDGKSCTQDSCAAATGCVHTPLTGSSCDDGSKCTVDDTCTGTGSCSGATAFCCQAGKTPGSCGYSYEGNLDADSLYLGYSASCGSTSYPGGDRHYCLPLSSPLEVCVDFPAGQNGGAFVLKDVDDVMGVPSQCTQRIDPGTCAAVPAVSGSDPFAHWLVTLDSTTAGADVRYHVRCPTSKVCASSETLSCNTAVKCGNTGWTSHDAETDYGTTCGMAPAGNARAFVFTAPAAGDYTLWLGNSANELGMVFYAGAKSGTCQTSACTLTTASAPGSPLHFVASAASEKWCIYLEDPNKSLGSTTVSASCYQSLPVP